MTAIALVLLETKLRALGSRPSELFPVVVYFIFTYDLLYIQNSIKTALTFSNKTFPEQFTSMMVSILLYMFIWYPFCECFHKMVYAIFLMRIIL